MCHKCNTFTQLFNLFNYLAMLEKFIVNSKELKKALNKVQSAVPSSPRLPLLKNLFIQVSGPDLTLKANDLDIEIETTLEVKRVSDANSFTAVIPAKKVIETIKALPDQPIKFVIEDSKCTILASQGKYHLATENPDLYPRMKAVKGQTIQLPATYFLNAIGLSSNSYSTDDLRPAMTGLYFSVKDNELTTCATDAHKLTKCVISLDESYEELSAIIPARALSVLRKLAEGQMLQCVIDDRYFKCNIDEVTTLQCILIDAKYPNFDAVIPVQHTKTITVDRQELINSLKRIQIFANSKSNRVIFNASEEDGVKLSSQDLDYNRSAQEDLSCVYDNQPIEIAFNAQFMGQMLQSMDYEEVHILMTDQKKPALIVPVEQADGIDAIALLMPVLIG